jgi:hypothetical protein
MDYVPTAFYGAVVVVSPAARAASSSSLSLNVAVRFAYVPLNGSPDPGTSRSSLVRLVVSVHNSIACTWRSLVISIVVRSVIVARPKE